MKAELKEIVNQLIRLDEEGRKADAAKYPNGLTLNLMANDDAVKEVLFGETPPMISLVEDLSKEDLIYLTALTWFGRGDGVAEPGATFESVLKYAQDHFDDGSVGYLCGMPLSKYLPKGMKRLGIL